MKILHNHLGYRPRDPKIALVQSSAALPVERFSLHADADRRVVFSAALRPRGPVRRWRDWLYWEADFSEYRGTGEYFISVPTGDAPLVSHRFAISPALYDAQLLSDLLHYVKSQRCTGVFDQADRSAPVFGSEQRLDVHGGWYDASGDCSKYLSHLSYANVMNPQQTPQVVWNLLAGRDLASRQPLWMDERIVDEALHGADFLVRMQHPDGFFCMTVFDRWSKDVNQRRICSYATQQGHLSDSYQAAYRQGGGSTIAALARASRLPRDGEHAREAYLDAARRGFAHLEAHNCAYLDDGRENIVDDYCALLAATELLATTGDPVYAAAAERRVERLAARQDAEGWFWADDGRTRSFFHAADAGLPGVALLRFADVAPESPAAATARRVVREQLRHEIAITREGEANPFAYPRQHIRMPGREPRVQFFIPHDNESGYWWQGENARLASIASAALWAARHDDDPRLHEHAHAALGWIFGRNPFDACMMQGRGQHNPRYEPGYWNAPGGVCNGITSGLDDEDDIDFKRPEETTPLHSWRWSEQWLPHGAWLFLALALTQASATGSAESP